MLLLICLTLALAVMFSGSTVLNQGPNYNILFVTCHIGTSHKKSAIPFLEHLSKFGGHNLTVFSTFYKNPPIASEHVTMVDLNVWTENQAIMDQYVHGNSSGAGLNPWLIRDSRNIDFMPSYEMANDVCKRAVDQHPDIFQHILETPWDIIMLDTYFSHCAYVISAIGDQYHRTSIKLLYSPQNPFQHTIRHVGIPTSISDNYDWQAGYDYRMFWYRLKHAFWFELVDYYFTYYASHRIQVTLFDYKPKSPLLNPYYEKLGKSSKFSMWEFDQNSSFTFYQYPDDLGVHRPHLQTDIAIGQLRCTTKEDAGKLSDVYERFISDSTSEGTILFALGHYVNWDYIPNHVSQSFHSAFQQFPNYRFIWQFIGNLTSSEERRSLVNTSNILIVDWLPQLQLLHHIKTRLIVSQLGIKSTLEVICTSMPTLALPTWGDQPLTARLLTIHNDAGKLLNRDLISTDYIANSIREVLANEHNHKARLDKLRAYTLDKPIESNELGRFWIEYSVRNHDRIRMLTARGRFLCFPVYYCLDVILVSFVCLTILTRFVVLIIMN